MKQVGCRIIFSLLSHVNVVDDEEIHQIQDREYKLAAEFLLVIYSIIAANG